MNEWKVVPVEPTPKMVAAYSAAAEDLIKRHHLSGSYPATWQPVEAGYTAMLAAAPTPPVVLPPLPSHPEHVYVWTSDEKRAIEDYARSALAQYGIKEKSDE